MDGPWPSVYTRWVPDIACDQSTVSVFVKMIGNVFAWLAVRLEFCFLCVHGAGKEQFIHLKAPAFSEICQSERQTDGKPGLCSTVSSILPPVFACTVAMTVPHKVIKVYLSTEQLRFFSPKEREEGAKRGRKTCGFVRLC